MLIRLNLTPTYVKTSENEIPIEMQLMKAPYKAFD